MKDVEIKSLYRESLLHADSEITVRGWVRTNRGSNKFGFIELNDGTFFKSVQVVYEAEFLDNFEEIAKAPIAAALKVTGTFVLTPDAKQPQYTYHPEQPEEAAQHGVPERDRASQTEKQHVLGGVQGKIDGGICYPQVLPGQELRICAHSDNHCQRLRGRR